MRDSEKAGVAREHRALLILTAPAAVVIVFGFALTGWFVTWNYGRLRDESVQSVATNTARDLKRGKRADFDLCEAIRSNAATLKAVIDTSYMTANPSIDLAKLPPATQRLFVDFAPILGAYAEAAKASHDKVIAQVKDPPTCIAPTSRSGASVVSSVPTTRSGTTTTTLAR